MQNSLCVVASTADLDSCHKHSAARCETEDFAKHLRKTHEYTSYVHLLHTYLRCELKIWPVTLSAIKKLFDYVSY